MINYSIVLTNHLVSWLPQTLVQIVFYDPQKLKRAIGKDAHLISLTSTMILSTSNPLN